MTPISINPLHQRETEFTGETQVFSGPALLPDDPSLEPRERKGRPTRENGSRPGEEKDSPEKE